MRPKQRNDKLAARRQRAHLRSTAVVKPMGEGSRREGFRCARLMIRLFNETQLLASARYLEAIRSAP